MQNQFTYTFRLTSSSTKINLPFILPSSKSLKILYMTYTTASTATNHNMRIRVSGFNNNVYMASDVSGNIIMDKCVTTIPLSSAGGTEIAYINTFNDTPDVLVSEKQSGLPLNQLNIEILIDDVYSPDITYTNPVFLSILIK